MENVIANIDEIEIQSAQQDFVDQKEKNFRKLMKPFFPVITLFTAAIAVFVPRLFDRDHYEISTYSIVSGKIQFPFRIVHLSDFHNSVFGNNNDQFVDDIVQLKPDVILMTGDMITAERNGSYQIVTDILTRLIEQTNVPLFYIYGNHEEDEIRDYGNKLIDEILSTGAVILENEMASIEINRNKVDIGGLNLRSGRSKKYQAKEMLLDLQKSSNYKILLEHYPEYFLELKEKDAMLDIDLALSGHAHGGVARIPFIGSLYAPGQGFFPKLTEGMHKFNDCTVVVSRGLGGRQFPPRINNRPEIVVIDVTPTNK